MPIRIAANAIDARLAGEINMKSWKAAYKGILSGAALSAAPPLDAWAAVFSDFSPENPFPAAIYSAEGKDLGVGKYGPSRDYPDDGSKGEIGSVYFLEEAWGKGYAKELLFFMVDRLKEKGREKIHLWVLKENARARRFYEKCGFAPTGKEKEINLFGDIKTEMEFEIQASRL